MWSLIRHVNIGFCSNLMYYNVNLYNNETLISYIKWIMRVVAYTFPINPTRVTYHPHPPGVRMSRDGKHSAHLSLHHPKPLLSPRLMLQYLQAVGTNIH